MMVSVRSERQVRRSSRTHPTRATSFLLFEQFGEIAGAQRVALQMIERILLRGDECLVVSPEGPFAEAVTALGARHECYTHLPQLLLSGYRAIRAGRDGGRRIAILSNGPRTWAAAWFLRWLGGRWIAYLHSRPTLRWQRALLRLLSGRADDVVLVAEVLRDGMPRRARVIPNCARRELLVDAGTALQVGNVKFLGRADRVKGFDHYAELTRICQTAASAPNLTFWAGVSSSLRQAEAPASAANIALSEDKTAEWFKPGDLVVVPSEYEACPLVVLEAQARGAVVVAYAVGGIAEIVHDGTDGFLVTPRSPSALARVLLDVAADHRACADVSRRAREAAASRCREWETALEALLWP